MKCHSKLDFESSNINMPPQETTLSKEDVEGFEEEEDDLPIAIPKKNVSMNCKIIFLIVL